MVMKVMSNELASGQTAENFEKLIGISEKRAYRMAYELTRNATDAEDLVQETYLKAWKGFDSYAIDKPFLNWLLRIMQRAYLDSRRRANPIRKADSLQAIAQSVEGEIQELTIADPSPIASDELLFEEYQQQLSKSLDMIPEIYATAIRQCDLDGMSYYEIAEQQNTTIGTIRSRIHRGRKLLRGAILKGEYQFSPHQLQNR
jgi:RNA polymerase sigma-70 factor, ECF subfamily